MNYKILMVLVSVFISGCATQGVSNFNYMTPTQQKTQNELEVASPQSEVWDILVKEIAKSFYVINNIDKESRIINVSFMSNNPEEYVDCGRSHRTYSHDKENEVYDYEVAGSNQYKLAYTPNPPYDQNFSYYTNMRRVVSLEGRSNIYVAPSEKDPNNTTISVNTRYILTINVRGETYAKHFKGLVKPLGPIPGFDPTIIMFNTNQRGEHIFPNGKSIVCYSKGKLETEILEMKNSK